MTKLRMSVPNNWETDTIDHVAGNLWWNKTTGVKFFKVGIEDKEIQWVDNAEVEMHYKE